MPAQGGMVVKRAMQVLVVLVVEGLILFGTAGSFDWPMAWALLIAYVVMIAISSLVVLARHPDLIGERAQMKADTKSWDRVLSSASGTVGPLLVLLVAGLDRRFGGASLPHAVSWFFLALFVSGLALFLVAMAANRFFSAVVRIQTDRGHFVVSNGPYRFVRHPGYVGGLLYTLAMPLALGSMWALIPSGVTAILIVVRTALEDRTLQAELPGYREYASRVRYRLIPGLW